MGLVGEQAKRNITVMFRSLIPKIVHTPMHVWNSRMHGFSDKGSDLIAYILTSARGLSFSFISGDSGLKMPNLYSQLTRKAYC